MTAMDEIVRPLTKLRAAFAVLAATEDIRYGLCFGGTVQWGLGGNETAIFSEGIRLNTCRTSYILGIRRGRGRIPGGKRRGQAFPTVFERRPEVAMHQGIQSLCRGQRPFGLRHHAVFKSGLALHPVRRAAECTVAKGGGRTGDEILPGHARALQGDEWRRLRDRGVEVSRRLPNWCRLPRNGEAPCSAKS